MDLLDALIKQSNDPTIKRTTEQLADQQYWSSVDTDSIKDAYVMPGYNKEESYVDWVRNVQAGGGQQGHLAWANSEAHFDWKKTWAGGYAGVGTPFWGIEVGGSWERADWLATSSDISVELNLQAWDTIQIQDAGWFDQAFVTAKADGEYRSGFNRATFFGPTGSMALRKTAMLVVYKPSFVVTSSTAFSSEHREKFEAAAGLRIGPFRIGGGGGFSQVIQDKALTQHEFSGGSDSETPLIAGITIQPLG